MIAGCNNQIPNNNIPTENNSAENGRGVGFMPSSDFVQSLKDADSSGIYIGFYAPFEANKDIPEIIKVAYEYKLDSKPIVNLNFFNAGDGKELPGYEKEAYKKQILNIVSKYKPEYIGIGNELNMYKGNMDDIAELNNEIYAEIKKVSPGTKVFTVFQYEHLDDMSIVEKFDIDMVGITTYPFIKGYKSSNDIPDDYYNKLVGIKKPIIFTEVGHNSIISEDDQANFIDVFYNRIKKSGVKPEIVVWGLLYDYPKKGEIWNAGLFTKDGEKKKAFYKWTQE